MAKSPRARACDFRRLRFARNASFSRAWRSSFAGLPDRPSRLSLPSFIVDPFECVRRERHISQRPGRWTKIRHRRPRQRVPDVDCMPFLTASPPDRACAGGGLVARIGAPWWGLLADSRIGACCRSSVVEHSIGNGEVDSSILSGSTSFLIDVVDLSCTDPASSHLPIRPRNHRVTTGVPTRPCGMPNGDKRDGDCGHSL